MMNALPGTIVVQENHLLASRTIHWLGQTALFPHNLASMQVERNSHIHVSTSKANMRTDLSLSPMAVMLVIDSWEISRQRLGFDEKLGIDTLLL